MMKPVEQTKIVIRDNTNDIVQHGNCFAACIASLLEVPITDVPNVETLFYVESGLWAEVMDKFLISRGYDLLNDQRFEIYHKETGCDPILKFSLSNKLYLASGKSSRGVNHICIYRAGQLIHDPHPSKEGLLTFENFQTLESLKTQTHEQ